MNDIVLTIDEWLAQGLDVATATLVRVRRSSPRLPGAAMALASDGRVVGSVTGGCVEPDLIATAEQVLADGMPRLNEYGFADSDAFEVGLPCGGEVEVLVERAERSLMAPIADAIRADRPTGYVVAIAGDRLGERVVFEPDTPHPLIGDRARRMLELGTSGVADEDEGAVFVHALLPRPDLYVFGAIDFASAVAEIGSFMGYRVTVCDPRETFITRERFPRADELVLRWPHEFLAEAPVDARTAICVLTHDEKFDVPALTEALRTPAGYIGAMGSRRTTERREARLREQGISDEQLERIHAPIGLAIGSKTPQEVAIAIAAQIVESTRSRVEVAREASARV